MSKLTVSKIVGVSLLWISVSGCDRFASMTATSQGFDKTGHYRMLVSGSSSHGLCGAGQGASQSIYGTASESLFAARCADSGFKILSSDDCTTLCSQAVEL